MTLAIEEEVAGRKGERKGGEEGRFLVQIKRMHACETSVVLAAAAAAFSGDARDARRAF